MATEFSFANTVLAEIVKWMVPLIGGFIALFFTPVVEKIKIKLNKAELRTKPYEEFARDLSSFIFEAEIQHEFHSAKWATQEDINEIVASYNVAITTLRSKEIVYLSWAKRYWSSQSYPKFEAIMTLVRKVDQAVHLFNDSEITEARLNSLAVSIKELHRAALDLLDPEQLR